MTLKPLKVAMFALFGAVVATGCRCGGPETTRQYGDLGVVSELNGTTVTNRDATYDFETVFMGQSKTRKIVIQNRGSGSLTLVAMEKIEGDTVSVAGDDNPVWTVAFEPGLTLGSSDVAEIDVTFTPPQAEEETVDHTVKLLLRTEGAREGEETATITLIGRGVNGVCDLPDRLDFGTVARDEMYQMSFEIKNPTDLPADAQIGEIYSSSGDDAAFTFAPDSAVGAITVEPDSSARVIIDFRPTESKSYLAFMKAKASEGCPEEIIELTGNSVDTVLTWVPAKVDCGYATPGIEVVRDVTFTNAGNDDVEISGISTVNSTEFYVVADDGVDKTRLTVPGRGGTAVLKVACKPAVLGPRQTTLNFRTPLAKQPTGAITVSVFGGGPDIQVSPAPNLNFGKVAYFANTNPPVFQNRKLTVMNVGTRPAQPDPNANLYLGQPDGSGGYGMPYVEVTPLNGSTSANEFTVTVPSSYDPGVGLEATIGKNAVDLVVTVTPESVGLKQAEIKIYSNDPDEPVVTVVATADAVVLPPCNYTVSPSTVNFGLIEPPSYRDLGFNITNNGTAAGDICLINGLDLGPNTNAFFSLPNGKIDSRELQPGETLQVIVRVHPTGQTPSGVSNISGTVDFYVSSPTRPSAQVFLTAQLAPSCLTIAPNALSFGTVQVGCSSSTRTFSIYNTCSSPVTIPFNGFSMQAAAGQTAGGPDCPGPQDCPEFLLVQTPPIPPSGLVLNAGDPPVTFQVKYKPIDIGSDTGAVAISAVQNSTNVTYVVSLDARGDTTGIQTDIYTQDAKPKADILLVIDDSGSMSPYQQALADNFASFIKYAMAAAVDYHIAVITTEVGTAEYAKFRSGPGHPEKVLTPTTQDVENKFKAKVNVGATGGNEREAEPALMALTPPLVNSDNAGFLRNDAALAVVAVTDEPDHSPNTASYYLNGFWNIKGFNRKSMFTFNAIAGFTSPSPCGAFNDDGMLATLVTQSNGVKEDICTPDWAKALENLGKTAFGFRTNFFLTSEPDLSKGPIEVRINNVLKDPVDDRGATIWTYDSVANSVNFEPLYVPEPGQTMTITYHTTCFP